MDNLADDPDGPTFRVDAVPGEMMTIFRLHGELDVTSTGMFTSAIDNLDPSHRSVVLDLGGVTFIDSTGIGSIVAARRNLESRFVTLSITNPSERARFVFDLTGLSDLIAAE